MWFEARERHLGHISAYSFDLQGPPPGVGTGKACVYETICSSRESFKERESKCVWIRNHRKMKCHCQINCGNHGRQTWGLLLHQKMPKNPQKPMLLLPLRSVRAQYHEPLHTIWMRRAMCGLKSMLGAPPRTWVSWTMSSGFCLKSPTPFPAQSSFGT